MSTRIDRNVEELKVVGDWIPAQFLLLEGGLNGNKQSALHRKRTEALALFLAHGFPTAAEEEWRKTDISELAKLPLTAPIAPNSFTLEEAEALFGGSLPQHRLVFVDGVLSSSLSVVPSGAGVTIASISDLIHGGKSDQYLEFERSVGAVAKPAASALIALNAAFLSSGTFIEVAPKLSAPLTLSLLNITSNQSERTVSHPRTVLVVGENSECVLTEYFLSSSTQSYYTNIVTEVVVHPFARVTHTKVQCEGDNAYHTGTLAVEVHRSATFASHTISFGGGKVRNEIAPMLLGEGIHCTMNGLSVLNGTQHVDNHTVLNHAKPHCESSELFKGVYDDTSSGVFRGTIIVQQDAQKTNAFQSNQSILLSDSAKIDSEPQLKIWADDVKCTHGATVGQLDETALFYLRARGIGKVEARSMLIHAFASGVLSTIADATLREELERRLTSKLQVL